MTTTTSTANDTISETTIEADPTVPMITIVRDFAATPDRVYRAWADPALAAQWLGPRSTTMRIDEWDLRTGGSWRYSALVGGEPVASFYGSFHEARPDERIVQTFTYEGFPDGVALETVTFEAIDGGRTRVTTTSVVGSFEDRDAMLASGMEVGVNEGYEKLDELLAAG